MKKFSFVAILMLVLLTFAGCWNGEAKSNASITSEKGKGSKTISFTILKDHVKKPDGNGTVEDNSKYFPKGIGAVTTWLKSNVPAGFDITFAEKADYYLYTLSYSFNDIADYNAKTKALAGANWAKYALQDATLTASEKDGGYEVTFKESGKTTEASIKWALDGIFKNSQIFDPRAGKPDAEPVTEDTIFKVMSETVKVGEKATTVQLDKNSNVTVTATGTVSKTAAQTPTETPGNEEPDSSNPSTGDNINTYVILTFLSLVGMTVVFTRKRRLN
ncbi:LPXTG cell wall anchor domain-containing protein [Clostridium swellfunianum]|uniref:LPXTG cell wall anchor domain-containing protein n=1 Tax=Clostridium swellfunianum TaxID=1367462 RepID=UPI002030EE12|nr:LPXTG cell wall anchor domain-containing protein [Clostridium swellfunianum]MCM0647303.1 LPXTG cell wall anchor domain-containing protein [Clostridium swellfunianum]